MVVTISEYHDLSGPYENATGCSRLTLLGGNYRAPHHQHYSVQTHIGPDENYFQLPSAFVEYFESSPTSPILVIIFAYVEDAPAHF